MKNLKLKQPFIKSQVFAFLILLCCTGTNVMAGTSRTKAKAVQQGITITGKVTAENGEPLPGVNITIKGTAVGSITNVDGSYTLNVPDKTSIIVYSFIGYLSQEVTVADQTTINISLSEDIAKISEVVVTALGIKKQTRSLGYSTTEVQGDEFTNSRTVNIGNSLTGKIAGVSVANNSTGAAGSSRVIIRGNASLTGNNMPLYVVDGIPYDNTNQGSATQYGGLDLGDGLSSINPDDIESIQVLKGVAASALYGFRGGNGAILITTKSGSKSKGVQVEVNNNFTLNTIIDYRDFQYKYGQGTQGIKPTSASSALSTYSSSWGAEIDGSDYVNFLGNTVPYEAVKDNWDNFYRSGINNQSTLSVSGASDMANYRVGVSNLYNHGNIKNSYLKQQGINLNTTFHITERIHLNLTANYTFEKVKNRSLLGDGTSNVNATLMYLPTTFDVRWMSPMVDDDGNELVPGTSQYFNNPYFVMYKHSNKTSRNRLTGGLTLRYDIFDWLYMQGQVTRDGYIFDFKRVTPTGTAYSVDGELTEYEKNYREINANYLVGFNKNINEDFTFSATVGGNIQDNMWKQYGTDGTATGYVLDGLYTASNMSDVAYGYDYSQYRVNSLYGTADFGFRNYLFLNLTGRNDWFSTLALESNHYFYPSVSTSFVFTEAFDLPEWVYFGKIRASYAEGSNGTEPYQNSLSYGFKSYEINGQAIGEITNSEVPNAGLKPVQIQEEEIGLNAQLFQGRIGIDFAVYNKETTDDIATVTSSTASGYSSAVLNVGKIRNRGVEALLNVMPVKTSNFKWDVTFNIAYNTSKVLYLGNGVESLQIEDASARYGDVTITNVVGKPYGQITGYGYTYDDNGNRIFDEDGEPVRTSSVKTFGSGVYKTTGGIRNAFTYRNISIACLIDFKYGAKIFSGTNLSLYGSGLHKKTLQGRESGYIGDGVTEDGDVNTTAVDAETYWSNIANSNSIAEEFIYDASFIKLRELSLGYQIPSSILQNVFIQSAQISIISRNLLTLMKHTPNIDPESSYNSSNGQGLELNGLPPTRSFGVNINVKF